MITNPTTVLIPGDDRRIDLNLNVNYTDCTEIQVDVVVAGVVKKTYKKSNTDDYKVFPNTDTSFEKWAIVKLYSSDTASFVNGNQLALQITLEITDPDFPDGSRRETQLLVLGLVGQRYA